MKIRGDIERVNLATGERYQRVTGDGESRLEKVSSPSAEPVTAEPPEHSRGDKGK